MSGVTHPVTQHHVPQHSDPQAAGSLHIVGCDTSKGCIECFWLSHLVWTVYCETCFVVTGNCQCGGMLTCLNPNAVYLWIVFKKRDWLYCLKWCVWWRGMLLEGATGWMKSLKWLLFTYMYYIMWKGFLKTKWNSPSLTFICMVSSHWSGCWPRSSHSSGLTGQYRHCNTCVVS